jgi:hypothetical protein
MRRADGCDLTPHERDELTRLLHTLIQVKEAVRSFDDGEVNLRDAFSRMEVAVVGVRARGPGAGPLPGKIVE